MLHMLQLLRDMPAERADHKGDSGNPEHCGKGGVSAFLLRRRRGGHGKERKDGGIVVIREPEKGETELSTHNWKPG